MFLFDADKAANGGIFRELWAIVRNFAMTSGLRLAAAIIVLLLGLKIAKAVLKRYEKSRAFQKIVPDVRGVVRWLAGFLLYALIIVLVIGILGIPLASVATIISSAAIAVGLALQGSLSNLAGGIVILAFKPFHVGDVICKPEIAGVGRDGVFGAEGEARSSLLAALRVDEDYPIGTAGSVYGGGGGILED